MRLTEYAIGTALLRAKERKMLLRLAVLADLDALSQLVLLDRSQSASTDVRKVKARSFLLGASTFNINVYSSQRALQEFRFLPNEIPRIAVLFNYNRLKTKRSKDKTDSITACCIVLRQLASPCRWVDVEMIFGMHSSALSEIFWKATESFIQHVGHVLDFRPELMQLRAELYANAIQEKGSPLDNIVGFIDCTKIELNRPGGASAMQRACYSEHKRYHGLIYQTITTPDGLIFHLYGPEVGRRHEMTLYRESGLNAQLEASMCIGGRQYALCGDRAYMLRPWLQVGFPTVGATAAQVAYNKSMSSVREAVEWSYKDLKQM